MLLSSIFVSLLARTILIGLTDWNVDDLSDEVLGGVNPIDSM